MSTIQRTFQLLTSAFPHGAYQSPGINRPDLRAPSVKGQLRWWYDALFEDPNSEQRLFGYVSSNENRRMGLEGNQSSKVIVRIRSLTEVAPVPTSFIPHKAGGGNKNAIPVGSRYELSLLQRREGVSDAESQRLELALDAWLLLGGIGQRASRGAGSVWPDGAPETSGAFRSRADLLLQGSRIRYAILGRKDGLDDMTIRHLSGDFLADVAFGDCQTPFGSAEPRKPSPLRLRAVRLDGELRIVAVFDSRFQSRDTLRMGIARLAREKEIGRLLHESVEDLCA